MAGVVDTGVLDVVAEDPDGRTIALYLLENRRWGTDPLQYEQLKQKINNYASWVLDGDIAAMYPQTAGRPTRLHLRCVEAPDQAAQAIIEHGRQQLAGYDIDFDIEVAPERF